MVLEACRTLFTIVFTAIALMIVVGILIGLGRAFLGPDGPWGRGPY